ncbi:hypothetical protein HOLleu_38831 [Holothuria leucospilota]|uniref:Uncharacterized protein n=1 Tax=Holothuria leucospilota TaxID=206669 RepID=A0A9Q0YJC0_HOLLE|nr:hypothetical protein HOLleu_38831 [Holothuria leucospilota]
MGRWGNGFGARCIEGGGVVESLRGLRPLDPKRHCPWTQQEALRWAPGPQYLQSSASHNHDASRTTQSFMLVCPSGQTLCLSAPHFKKSGDATA